MDLDVLLARTRGRPAHRPSRLLRLLRDERGLSLVELVVALAIMGVIFGSISGVLARSNTAEKGLNYRFQDQTAARTALDRLRNDVRCARAATGSGSTVTLTLPAGCSAGASVTWCTAGSGTRYGLYRRVGTTCSSADVRWADYLTTGSVFTISAQSPTSLAKVSVDLPVSRRAQPHDVYELKDDIVLRNSTRS